jgi:ribosomal protein S18 acetylase RimI-like enzyme
MQGIGIRVARDSDAGVLEQLLGYAVDFRLQRPTPAPELLADPQIAGYVAGWPRPGDLGVLAIDAGGDPLGGCWLRYRARDRPGYGFVREDIPEITLAVLPRARGDGIGRRLLRCLIARARAAGIATLSLSVERANTTAARLYRSEGWQILIREPDADTMILHLSQPADAH